MAGLSVRDEVDYENTESKHCIIGTVYTVDGFLHSSQKVQCYTTLPSLKHIFKIVILVSYSLVLWTYRPDHNRI